MGMSGGVDSSVTAEILKKSGYCVTGVTLKLCSQNAKENSDDAAAVCKKMGIGHINLDLSEGFNRYVIENFINEYKLGNTPNPCIECNKHIKFGKMLDFALENGFDKIATGHYARVKRNDDGRFLLCKAKDSSKDQSYVLYNLTQRELSHLLFPLGDKTKAQVRKIAEENSFASADRPDSQDICFVPDGDYAAFIEMKTGEASQNGDYIDVNGKVLGEHKGVISYTLGQRKGLGIALGKPQFVIDKNPITNQVVLGDEALLFKKTVIADKVNLISIDNLEGEMEVTAKLRYRHNPARAVLSPIGDGKIKITFEEAQRAPSPGQAAVFYNGEIVVGGGTITESY